MPSRRAVLRHFVCAAVGGALAIGAATHAATSPAVLLVVGDSISAGYGLPKGAGWVDLLAERIDAQRLPFRVVNASITGDTTAGGRARLPTLLAQHKPAVVVVELGGNDGLRGGNLRSTKANLDAMVADVLKSGAKAVLVGMKLPPNYGPAYTREFEALFGEVAQSRRAAFVPFLFAGFGESSEWFQPDRVHPTAAAQPKLLDNVWPVLSPPAREAEVSTAGPRDGRTISVDALGAYPDRVDVRTPSEFAEDRVPGAENHPVLDDAERARIGAMYAKESFAARRTGAALVARNIATMLEGSFAARSRDWAPVVYCWRGGQRSRSLTHMLNEIGWRAVQLDGGYRAWRRYVMAQVDALPPRFHFEVVCGLTGSGKSRLIEVLAAEGMQVLDLEALAKHRGSLLGDLPGEPQPSQKWFESQLVAALERLDPRRPVYVESESKRIGTVQVPDALLAAIRAAPCIRLDTPAPLRIALLKDEYAHYLDDAPSLSARLAHLVPLHGRKTIEDWETAAATGDWDTLVSELLARHYDPTYARAIERNFAHLDDAIVVAPSAVDAAAFRTLARALDAAVRARNVARTPAPA